MASRMFSPSLFAVRPSLIAAGVAGSSLLLLPQLNAYRRAHLYWLDSSPVAVSPRDWSFSQYQHDARTPVVDSKGGLNARAVRQMSLGSILGLFAGLGISMFSKSLVLLVGLGIVGIQTAESYGIQLIPYNTIRKYVSDVDLRSAVQDNVAFKMSFGMMFALSAFAHF